MHDDAGMIAAASIASVDAATAAAASYVYFVTAAASRQTSATGRWRKSLAEFEASTLSV